MHNLILSYMNIWDPNVMLGDMQMMALSSWMTHEEVKDEVKKVMEKEEKESVYMRAEKISPMFFINNHSIISNDVDLAPKYHATQEQVISHFEDTLRRLGTESQKAC